MNYLNVSSEAIIFLRNSFHPSILDEKMINFPNSF